MKLVATRLIHIGNGDESWRKQFADPLFRRHLCLGVLYRAPSPEHPGNVPSSIFISSPDEPAFPLEPPYPAGIFLAWFDIEWKDNLEGFVPMLVRKGELRLNGMVQHILPALQLVSEAAASENFKRLAFEKCIESSLYAIIANILSEKENIHDIVERAVIYMNANMEKALSLDDISNECGVSKEHLIRLFRKRKGMTPMKYFSNMRLKKSMDMLAEGMKIRQIVAEMNFSNESYFSKLFKEYFGYTPSSFKRRHGESRAGKSAKRIEKNDMSTLITEFINQMSDLFFIKDSDFNTVACNRAYCEFVGLPLSGIIGKKDFDLFHEREALFFRMSDKFILDSKRDGVFRKWLPFPDGKKYYVETRKTPYYDEQGNFLGLICIGRRIRDEKEIIVSEAGEMPELEQ